MATPTTTYPTIRDQWITVVEGLTPSRLADRFELAPETELPWRDAAEQLEPAACFRRFRVVRLGDYRPALISDGLVEQAPPVRAELVVAYPVTWARYDHGSRRGEIDLEDLIDADAHSIAQALGITGSANYVSGQSACWASWRVERPPRGTVALLVVELETIFYRAAETAVPAATQNSAEQTRRYTTVAESDEHAIVFADQGWPAAYDATYGVRAVVQTLAYRGVVAVAKEGTQATAGFTLSLSATVPIGTVIDLFIRDRA